MYAKIPSRLTILLCVVLQDECQFVVLGQQFASLLVSDVEQLDQQSTHCVHLMFQIVRH